MEHTPGPWRVCDDGYNVYAPNSDTAITDSQSFCFATPDETEANARLIAAAPDLLEACEAFVVAWEKSLQLEKTDVALRMAKIAIEKATGNEIN